MNRPRIPSKPLNSWKEYFSTKMLSYRVGDWPPPTNAWQAWAPYFTSMFSHFSVLHLGVNSFAMYTIAPALMVNIGILKTLSAFVITGAASSQIVCATDKAYARGTSPNAFKYIKRDLGDPNPSNTLTANHVGASGAIAGLFGILVTSVSFPKAGSSRLPSPILSLFLGFEAYAYYTNMDTGIGHGAHLAGFMSGAVLWLTWLRRARSPKYWAQWG